MEDSPLIEDENENDTELFQNEEEIEREVDDREVKIMGEHRYKTIRERNLPIFQDDYNVFDFDKVEEKEDNEYVNKARRRGSEFLDEDSVQPNNDFGIDIVEEVIVPSPPKYVESSSSSSSSDSSSDSSDSSSDSDSGSEDTKYVPEEPPENVPRRTKRKRKKVERPGFVTFSTNTPEKEIPTVQEEIDPVLPTEEIVINENNDNEENNDTMDIDEMSTSNDNLENDDTNTHTDVLLENVQNIELLNYNRLLHEEFRRELLVNGLVYVVIFKKVRISVDGVSKKVIYVKVQKYKEEEFGEIKTINEENNEIAVCGHYRFYNESENDSGSESEGEESEGEESEGEESEEENNEADDNENNMQVDNDVENNESSINNEENDTLDIEDLFEEEEENNEVLNRKRDVIDDDDDDDDETTNRRRRRRIETNIICSLKHGMIIDLENVQRLNLEILPERMIQTLPRIKASKFFFYVGLKEQAFCEYCGAIQVKGFPKNFCCSNGKYICNDLLPTLEEDIKEVFGDNEEGYTQFKNLLYSKWFARNCRKINCLMSPIATSPSPNGSAEGITYGTVRMEGPHFLKFCGRIQHYVRNSEEAHENPLEFLILDPDMLELRDGQFVDTFLRSCTNDNPQFFENLRFLKNFFMNNNNVLKNFKNIYEIEENEQIRINTMSLQVNTDENVGESQLSVLFNNTNDYNRSKIVFPIRQNARLEEILEQSIRINQLETGVGIDEIGDTIDDDSLDDIFEMVQNVRRK